VRCNYSPTGWIFDQKNAFIMTQIKKAMTCMRIRIEANDKRLNFV